MEHFLKAHIDMAILFFGEIGRTKRDEVNINAWLAKTFKLTFATRLVS